MEVMNVKTRNRYLIVLLSALLMAAMMLFLGGCGGSDEETAADDQKVAVGISWCEDINQEEHGEDLQAYINTVEKAGGEPVLLDLVTDQESAKAELAKCDVLIMTGGEDIDPSNYGQEPDPNLEDVNKDRDVSDMAMLQEAIEEDMPVLCTCRGAQLLNVVCGGTLIQDIPTSVAYKDSDILHRDPAEEDFTYHDIDIDEDSQLARIVGKTTLNVNSWHHQGIDEVGDGLKVTAVSGDGMIEGLEREDSSYVVAVQCHPEWHVEEGDDFFLVFFTDLMDQAD
jgi:putative glutamine amidotransferase